MGRAPLPLIAEAWLRTNASGFTLIESLLSIALFAILVTASLGAYLSAQESLLLNANRAQALLLADEGLEATRNLRDAAYANITTGPHGLATSSGQWVFSGTSDVTGIFTRQVTVADIDTYRKSVVSQVTWAQNDRRSGTISLETRLANWARIATNWSTPVKLGSADASGTTDGYKVDTVGSYAYLVRNASVTDNFLIYDLSNPAAPTLVSSLTLTGAPTNIQVSGNYAYVSNSSDTQELQIISIGTPASPSVVGTYNATGNADGLGVAVNGSVAYLLRASSSDPEIFALNVSTPSAPMLMGSFDTGATATEAVVVGTNVFVASANNSRELEVISFAIPLIPGRIGSLDLPNSGNVTSIALSGTTVIVGQGSAARLINIATPTAPTLISSFSASGNINDVTFGSTGYAFLATAASSAEFQVLDISTLSAPVLAGSVDITGTGTLNGISYNGTLNLAPGASVANTEELPVFGPQ